MKTLNYGLFLWLPYYFRDYHGQSEDIAGSLEASYSLGGILGSICIGYLTDYLNGRFSVINPALVILALVLICIPNCYLLWEFYLLIPIAGFLCSGSANIITTVSADLAETSKAKFDVKTAVAGLVNGTSALGAAIGQAIIGILQDMSWNKVYLFLISITVLSFLSFLKPMMRDFSKFSKSKN
jgi:sugar phosphate permease